MKLVHVNLIQFNWVAYSSCIMANT